MIYYTAAHGGISRPNVSNVKSNKIQASSSFFSIPKIWDRKGVWKLFHFLFVTAIISKGSDLPQSQHIR